jgi:hypothetical protein
VELKRDVFNIGLGTVGTDGKGHTAVAGVETDEELREMATKLTCECCADRSFSQCPFCRFGGISYPALINLLATMNRRGLLELFAMADNCRHGCKNGGR